MDGQLQIIDDLSKFQTAELIQLRDRLVTRAKLAPNDQFVQARVLYLMQVIGLRALVKDLKTELEAQRQANRGEARAN